MSTHSVDSSCTTSGGQSVTLPNIVTLLTTTWKKDKQNEAAALLYTVSIHLFLNIMCTWNIHYGIHIKAENNSIGF